MPFKNENTELIDTGHSPGLVSRLLVRWRKLRWVISPMVFLLLSCLIYRQVVRQPNWKGSLEAIGSALRGPFQWKLWVVGMLMLVNWGIEARKWQLALRPIGGMPWLDAYRAIFTGVTMASFTPNRMGEYLGRLLYVEDGHRLESIGLSIVCSMAQLLTTLGMGLAGLLYIRPVLLKGAIHVAKIACWYDSFIVLVFVLLVGLTITYCRLSKLSWILRKFPVLGKHLHFIKVLENFSATILLRILFLSFGRYLVFIVQYGLVFSVFGVSLGGMEVFGAVSVVFLIMAVVPTLTFLTELGLRWGTSMQVLALYTTNTIGIFAASFAVWLINLIVPALIGSLLILSIKLFKTR